MMARLPRSPGLWAALALGACLGTVPAPAAAQAPFPATYDRQIREAWGQYHPGDDWRWWKAQLWQESRLDPAARSPAGAEGVAQFMPGTARDHARFWHALGYDVVDPYLAEPSIIAGAFYMRRLVYVWRAPRSSTSRRSLAQASYNAGAGSLIRAQKRCRGAMEYEQIASCLPQVTGRFSRETLDYVVRIRRWFGLMVAGA